MVVDTLGRWVFSQLAAVREKRVRGWSFSFLLATPARSRSLREDQAQGGIRRCFLTKPQASVRDPVGVPSPEGEAGC